MIMIMRVRCSNMRTLLDDTPTMMNTRQVREAKAETEQVKVVLREVLSRINSETAEVKDFNWNDYNRWNEASK